MRDRLLLALLAGLVAAACTVSDPEPTTTTTTSLPPLTPLVLSPEGILPYRVGADAATVVAGIDNRVGGHDREIPWSAGETSILGRCPAAEVRAFGWGSLFVITERADPERFFTWSYGFDHETGSSGDPRMLDLATEDGIGLGTPRDELESLLGPRLAIRYDEAADLTTFTIDGDREPHIRGRLDASGVVDFLERVPGCG